MMTKDGLKKMRANKMKTIKYWTAIVMLIVLQVTSATAQKVNEERMNRDIEVAENVLATLIKQKMNQQRGMFGVEIRGTYVAGYGVTFKLPNDNIAPFFIHFSGSDNLPVISGGQDNQGYSYEIRTEEYDEEETGDDNVMKLRDRQREKRKLNMDSLRDGYYLKLVEASKEFILDYGDFISQLAPNEKIVITNQNENNRGWYFHSGKRTHISVEATKADINAFKQGKLSRDQALAKIKVLNTESVDAKSPDMELLTSIFSRLYSPDLSKTFFTGDNIYYELLKDYGVVYYMQVFSSNQSDLSEGRWNMPTLGMDNVDQATRDKKVVEIYPKFEQELKDNILEYGRTIKSLKDEEVLSFNVTLTRCKECGIPSTLELSIKSGVLKDLNAGKIDKNAALSKFTVKKGPNQ
jgi:hypothetical protein